MRIERELTVGGSKIRITSDTTIMGKLGTMGHGIIQHKADGIMNQFANAVRRELEGSDRA